MDIVVGIVGALAVAVHVWIFVMESVRWEHPSTRRVFGMSAEEARSTRELAFNQGCYNLFLAIILGVGVFLQLAGTNNANLVVVAGAGSMLGAALVLVAYSPSRLRAAIGQGLFPLLTLLALLVA